MKQVLIKQGQAVVEEIPAPQCEPGMVLVRVAASCISIGTEMSGVKSSGMPLWKRALANPDKVKQVFQLAVTQGVNYTRNLVESRLTAGNPTGYSAAGTVIEVGEGISDLVPGQRVACAGSQFAHHAEIISVPRNLVVPIPESLDVAAASTVTLGAIALQGVRRASPTLGETFVVIGLGLLGQLTVQLLKANGCRVIATDLVRSRLALAQSLGLDVGVHPDDGSQIEQVARLTDGIGADGVIITAASPSDAIVSTAFQMCRKKGRVVLVGDVGLNLNRADFYQKELDFFISSSYGPGRYDRHYEEQGLDYPVAYVRWTENRNMGEYLNLLAQGKVQVMPLVAATYPVEQASAAYASLEQGEAGKDRPLMVLLSYPQPTTEEKPSRKVTLRAAKSATAGQIRIAVIGAGGFAKSTHLPLLRELSQHYFLQAVVSRTGHNATATATQFGAKVASTDYQAVLADPDVDAVLISTRHNLHAAQALEALQAGKHVFVEKPLALTDEELAPLQAFYESAPDNPPLLLTGFNRRFSVYARQIGDLLKRRSNPAILNYRMNAGYLPLDSWVHGAEGGGRNRGEACHIYDLFTALLDSRVVQVHAQAITPKTGYYSRGDNFVTTLTFEDGSLATLTYTALGAKEYPKERLDVFFDGKVITLDNYQHLSAVGGTMKPIQTANSDKGHREELIAFASAIRQGGDWPIPLWQQVQATEIALAVERQIHISVSTDK